MDQAKEDRNRQLAAIIDDLDEDQLRQVVRDLAQAVPTLVNGRIARVMHVALPPTDRYVPRNGEVQD